jgi:osmotically-inducible protein OsmY
MRSDDDIRRDVEEELRSDPEVDPTNIAVMAKDGVVTLTGFVRSYIETYKAEQAAKRVKGVVAVANDIDVHLPGIDRLPDPDIARNAATAIRLQLPNAVENIKVVVRDGRVTLEGEVEWNYQREIAEDVVRRIPSVMGISNLIKVKPRGEPKDTKRKIEEAFKRNAEIDLQRISVEANDGEVILKGTARSWAERQEAERVAWSMPGIAKVDNRIVVSP